MSSIRCNAGWKFIRVCVGAVRHGRRSFSPCTRARREIISANSWRTGLGRHCAREYPWRVQKERFSGYTEYRIRESQYEIDREFGLAGRITSWLRITPNDKVNEGIPLNLSLADWYVFLYSIPHRPLAELEELYKNTPPQELYPIKTEWHAPGAEPWGNGIRTYTTDTAHAAGGKELDL